MNIPLSKTTTMFTGIELLISAILGFGMGISLMIVATLIRQSKLEELNTPRVKTNNHQNRIAPFIEIHKSFMEQPIETKEDSINRLKEKVESFKFRNRFYKG